MQKVYVLDINVLLCDPASILSFADRDVVIPMTVIEELDKQAAIDLIGQDLLDENRIEADMKSSESTK